VLQAFTLNLQSHQSLVQPLFCWMLVYGIPREGKCLPKALLQNQGGLISPSNLVI
jgi:hypothetical protein